MSWTLINFCKSWSNLTFWDSLLKLSSSVVVNYVNKEMKQKQFQIKETEGLVLCLIFCRLRSLHAGGVFDAQWEPWALKIEVKIQTLYAPGVQGSYSINILSNSSSCIKRYGEKKDWSNSLSIYIFINLNMNLYMDVQTGVRWDMYNEPTLLLSPFYQLLHSSSLYLPLLFICLEI